MLTGCVRSRVRVARLPSRYDRCCDTMKRSSLLKARSISVDSAETAPTYAAVPPHPEAPPSRRSAANQSALAAAILVWTVECVVACGLTSFFPSIALAACGSATEVAVIFASFPLATALVSPLVPWFSRRVGSRVTTLIVGLVVSAAGLAGFASAADVAAWTAWRVVQGVGCALVDVPAMGLVLTHSSDIARDVGLLESVSGVAYMIGPTVGGISYQLLGFEIYNLALAAVLMLLVVIMPVSLRAAVRAEPAVLTPPDGSGASFYGDLLSKPTVAWALAVICGANAVLLFYDTALEPHLKKTLGLAPGAVGLVFFCPMIIYATLAPYTGVVVSRFGAKRPMVLGCLIFSAATIALGPPPVPGGGDRLVVSAVAAWVVLDGLGSALTLLFALPLAKQALGENTPDVDDALSALLQAANATGQVLGPIVAGVLIERGYAWPEPAGSFFTASVTFSVFFGLLLAPCVAYFVPSDAPARDMAAQRDGARM
mmetsp:Transcript_5387/g.16595  ORF Transcript_5387/g.16595 Transcript_5387/m.16595 type:complete len:486 (+) Transcript_5387:85-1542(+)